MILTTVGAQNDRRDGAASERLAWRSDAAYLTDVSMIPVYGPEALRQRLRTAAARGTLPTAFPSRARALESNARSVAWAATSLLFKGERPCGRCQHCKYSSKAAHQTFTGSFRARSQGQRPDRNRSRRLSRGIAERVEQRGCTPRRRLGGNLRAVVRLCFGRRCFPPRWLAARHSLSATPSACAAGGPIRPQMPS